MRTISAALWTGLFLSFSLPAGTATAEVFPALIQYYIRTAGDTFMSYVQNALVKKAKTLGIKVDTYDASNNAEDQFSQFSEDINEATPIVIDLVDPKEGSKYIQYAEKMKTTLVFINRAPDSAEIINSRNVWYVGSISEEAGIFQANMIMDYLKKHPEYDINGNQSLDILLLRGPADHEDAINRTEKVLQALDQSGIKYRIVYDFTCNWSFELAFAETTRILNSKKQHLIDMVISNNDDMALGVINAYLENGTDTKIPPVFGVDAIPDALDAIADGTMTGTIKQDPVKMGETALFIACGEHNYEKLSKITGTEVNNHFIRIPYTTITR